MLTMRVREYVILAAGCVLVGIILALLMLTVGWQFGLNVFRNLWMLAIPAVLAVIINVLLLELYLRLKKKKP
jgi:membrane protein DedA with SNARE-associated domain